MKKVLFDITVLGSGHCHIENRTGVYRVAEKALEVLINVKNIDLYLTAFQLNDNECLEYLKENYPQYVEKFFHTKKFKLKNIFIKRFDICFSPYFKIPSAYRHNIWCKNIIIIHDLIQVLYPEWCQESCFNNYTKFLKSLNSKDYILCNSEYTKKDLLKYKTKLNKKRVSTIPLGVDEKYHSNYSIEEIQKVKNKYGINDKKYFFSISSMNPRKNFKNTVLAFIEFIEKNNVTDVALVLAGPKGWGDIFEGIDLNKYKEQIILTGFVDENDLPILYTGAISSVYISLYEGFGLPALESIYCNTPTIASNRTSIPEVVGDAGILVNPTNIDDIVEAYKSIYDNKFNLIEFQKNVQIQKQKFNWNGFKKAILEVIE